VNRNLRVSGASLTAGGAILLASCSLGSPEPKGALKYTGGNEHWCAPLSMYRDVAVGVPLDFTSGTPITLAEASLVHPEGLELVDTYVMPVTRKWRLSLTEFPPAKRRLKGWARRVPLAGAVVESGQARDLVARVRYTGPGTASFDRIRISYTRDESEFTTEAPLGAEFRDGEC
jgi:hypothetical protein